MGGHSPQLPDSRHGDAPDPSGAEDIDDTSAVGSTDEDAQPNIGWSDNNEGQNDEDVEVPATIHNTGVSMFSPPASAIKSPGARSSQSSDSSAPLSESPQTRLSQEVPDPTDITASALYDRVKFIVETGDAATLTKRSVRQTLALEYGTEFVK